MLRKRPQVLGVDLDRSESRRWNGAVSNFPQPVVPPPLPTRETRVQQPRAGIAGYLFEAAHETIAPMWQPGTYIRPCKLSSVVESPYSNVARETKRWLEHEIRHAAETRETSL